MAGAAIAPPKQSAGHCARMFMLLLTWLARLSVPGKRVLNPFISRS